MKKLAKVKLCDICRVDNGWHYNDDDGTAYRCPNLLNTNPVRSPERERDEAIAATGDADPEGRRQALEIVRDACQRLPEVSANDVRAVFDSRGLRRTLIAGAMRRAKGNGWMRTCGQVISDDPGTHAKLIDQHESLIFVAAGAEGRTA